MFHAGKFRAYAYKEAVHPFDLLLLWFGGDGLGTWEFLGVESEMIICNLFIGYLGTDWGCGAVAVQVLGMENGGLMCIKWLRHRGYGSSDGVE